MTRNKIIFCRDQNRHKFFRQQLYFRVFVIIFTLKKCKRSDLLMR